jgi:methionyl-tRNA synthetase
MLAEVRRGFEAAGAAIDAVRLRDGLAEAMAVARAANRYLEEQAPWKRLKTEPQAAATSLYVMAQVLSGLKMLFVPYLPFSSQRLHELLGFTGDVMRTGWRMEPVPAGQTLPTPIPLFAKLEPHPPVVTAGA